MNSCTKTKGMECNFVAHWLVNIHTPLILSDLHTIISSPELSNLKIYTNSLSGFSELI